VETQRKLSNEAKLLNEADQIFTQAENADRFPQNFPSTPQNHLESFHIFLLNFEANFRRRFSSPTKLSHEFRPMNLKGKESRKNEGSSVFYALPFYIYNKTTAKQQFHKKCRKT
jgi:hypothetical protein